jgi:hypothetical protein
MKAASSSETLVPVHQTTWYHLPEKCNLEVYYGCLLLFWWAAYQGSVVMLHNSNWIDKDFH